MSNHPDYLVVGHLNKAHGTKGELFAWPLTDHPEAGFASGVRLHLGDEDGRPIHVPETELIVLEARPFRRGYLVRFRGVDDREAAERIMGRYLLRPFAELEPAGEDEFFYHELLGLRAETVDGRYLGEVREVYELQPTHMVEVVGPERSFLLPLSHRVVARIDRDAGTILVDPPDGLLDI